MQGSLDLPTTRGWLALAGSHPAGFILVQQAADACEVLTFCVRPHYRRRGLGARLLQEAASGATGQPLLLEVAADNAAACALYGKLGFREFNRRRNYYTRGAAQVDAVLFRLEVAAA